MTNPTNKELDAAVAKCLGLPWYSPTTGKFHGPTGAVGQYHHNIASDFNALMAAVAKLEEERPDISFLRGQLSWFVIDTADGGYEELANYPFTHIPEARALALCIYAVVNR